MYMSHEPTELAPPHDNEWHTSGTHGTSLPAAESIIHQGFTDGGDGIWFATNERPDLAHTFGNMKAQVGLLAVIHASFPAHQETQRGMTRAVQITGRDVGKIVVFSVDVFNPDGSINQEQTDRLREVMTQIKAERAATAEEEPVGKRVNNHPTRALTHTERRERDPAFDAELRRTDTVWDYGLDSFSTWDDIAKFRLGHPLSDDDRLREEYAHRETLPRITSWDDIREIYRLKYNGSGDYSRAREAVRYGLPLDTPWDKIHKTRHERTIRNIASHHGLDPNLSTEEMDAIINEKQRLDIIDELGLSDTTSWADAKQAKIETDLASNTVRLEQVRPQAAMEVGLPETATWDEIWAAQGGSLASPEGGPILLDPNNPSWKNINEVEYSLPRRQS